MLYTKSILKEKSPEDGVRISVMSRHSLNDGITPDNRIMKDSFDKYLPILSPPSKLIGDYYKSKLNWEDYEIKYFEYLRKPEIILIVRRLAKRAIQQDITLLYIEDTAEKCHRRLLSEECQRYEPTLQIIHR